jgi:hypothetical protein
MSRTDRAKAVFSPFPLITPRKEKMRDNSRAAGTFSLFWKQNHTQTLTKGAENVVYTT